MASTKNIILIGRTGSGKSTLANVLVDEANRFAVGGGSVSKTKDIEEEIFEVDLKRDGSEKIKYRVIDTIGLGDTNMTPQGVLMRLAEMAGRVKREGLNRILFVTKGRFTKEEIEAYDLLSSIIFDKEVLKYTTIVRTGFEDFEDDEVCNEDRQALKEKNEEDIRKVEEKGRKELNEKTSKMTEDNQRGMDNLRQANKEEIKDLKDTHKQETQRIIDDNKRTVDSIQEQNKRDRERDKELMDELRKKNNSTVETIRTSMANLSTDDSKREERLLAEAKVRDKELDIQKEASKTEQARLDKVVDEQAKSIKQEREAKERRDRQEETRRDVQQQKEESNIFKSGWKNTFGSWKPRNN